MNKSFIEQTQSEYNNWKQPFLEGIQKLLLQNQLDQIDL
jgi:hypothetical protein